ncbi:MAG: NUDIX hydrolase [Pseudomonadota bacterium]
MSEPVIPRLSATVLLARDGSEGMEIFMVVRHHQIDFASGALVFPGGSLDASDRDPRIRDLADGAEGLSDDNLALRVAAARESFEECGVLLARDDSTGSIVNGSRTTDLGEKYRERLEANDVGMADVMEAEGLRLALDELVPFAHWITPIGLPKRFDTQFFLARAPHDHALAHDGNEAVDSVWITPQQALADADTGRRTLIFATTLNLDKVGRSETVSDALEAARQEQIVTVLPKVTKTESGRILEIPIEAGYGQSSYHMEGGPGSVKLAQKT